MSARSIPRGQPVLVFAMILGGWAILRVMLWTSPFPAVLPGLLQAGDGAVGVAPPTTGRGRFDKLAGAAPSSGNAPENLPHWSHTAPLPARYLANPPYEPIPSVWQSAHQGETRGPVSMQRISGHYLLIAAGVSNMNLPPEIVAFYEPKPSPTDPPTKLAVADRPLLAAAGLPMERRQGRWSGDGWLMWRDGSSAAAATPGAASYGRSQVGAVVRYRLASGPALPQAYARATHTLEGDRQGELAAGLSIRPVASLPVRVATEGRLTDNATGREIRPAVFAVTELPAAPLPLGLRGEAYVQAGFVGGRDATPFVDGQARVDGPLARPKGDGEFRAGLAIWGGAQEGASRLDVGPSATIAFHIGDAASRIAVDYRLRVAGEAEPASGPALTFSAGF